MKILLKLELFLIIFLNSHLGQSLSDDVVDIALSNILITSDPKLDSIHSFAEKADISGIFGTKWI